VIEEVRGDIVVIGLGETYYDAEYDFRIQVDFLLGDSRCPEGVQCVRAGNAKVRFEIIAGGQLQAFIRVEYHGRPKFLRYTVINNIEFRLVGVAPYPKYNVPVDPEAEAIVKLLAVIEK